MTKHLLCLAVLASALLAQPKFEVASIKPCSTGGGSSSSPGRLSLTCRPLMLLIQEAYYVFATGKINPLNPTAPLIPLEGGPDWVSSAAYVINAKAPTPQTMAMMRGPMMQSLLEERFQLKVHRETREVPVYAMVAGTWWSEPPSHEGRKLRTGD